MATGIISNSFFFEGRRGISDALFAINAVAFAWLALITLVRLLRFGPALWADLIDPGRVFGFFTMVAGSDVFGSGLSLRGMPALALVLWLVAVGLWLVLGYSSFCVLTFRNGADGADIVAGGWLNAIVGTQSLVILGTVAAPLCGELADTVFVLIHALWGIGLALYGIFIALFAARIFYRAVTPGDLTPMLWVVMGAAAISTNAGFDPDPHRQRRSLPRQHAPLHRWRDADDLGLGDVVDPAAGDLRCLEARRSPCAAALHAAPVEHGIPARHVFARDGAVVASRGLCTAAHRRARHDVDCARGLDCDRVGACRGHVAELAGRIDGRRRESLEIAVADIGLHPKRRLQDHRLPPGVIHALDHVRRMSAFGQERPHRHHD